jgi:hypothetical protein
MPNRGADSQNTREKCAREARTQYAVTSCVVFALDDRTLNCATLRRDVQDCAAHYFHKSCSHFKVSLLPTAGLSLGRSREIF